MSFHTIYLRTTLTVFSHLCPDLPCGLFMLEFPHENCISLPSITCYESHPSHQPWYYFLQNTWQSTNQWNFSGNILQPCVTSSLLVPKTVLSTLFSYRLSSHSSLDVINQVSCSHNIQNYSSANFNHCVFRQHTRREQESELRRCKHSSYMIISHGMKFWFVLIPNM